MPFKSIVFMGHERQNRFLALSFFFILFCLLEISWADSPIYLPVGLDHKQSLMNKLQNLKTESEKNPSNPKILTEIAELYLDMGDIFYTHKSQRILAYEEGVKISEKAIRLDEKNANAHFYFAANLGSAARLKGQIASLFTIQKLKTHVNRTLELRGNHSYALHMKGMLLEELPWLIGGNHKEALKYLQKAVEVKPDYAKARIDLARAYIKRKKFSEARQALQFVLQMESHSNEYVWNHYHRPEAEILLSELDLQQ